MLSTQVFDFHGMTKKETQKVVNFVAAYVYKHAAARGFDFPFGEKLFTQLVRLIQTQTCCARRHKKACLRMHHIDTMQLLAWMNRSETLSRPRRSV